MAWAVAKFSTGGGVQFSFFFGFLVIQDSGSSRATRMDRDNTQHREPSVRPSELHFPEIFPRTYSKLWNEHAQQMILFSAK